MDFVVASAEPVALAGPAVPVASAEVVDIGAGKIEVDTHHPPCHQALLQEKY